MKYKQIILNRSKSRGLYFTEHNLAHDREDAGEYVFINTASVYEKSNSDVWKKNMIQKFKDDTISEINKLQKVMKDLENLERSLNV